MAEAIDAARAAHAEGRTETQDNVSTQGEPHTVTEEPLVRQLNEDIKNREAESSDDGADDEGGGDEQQQARRNEQKPAAADAKAMPDGTYVVTRPDGTRVTLTEDELGKVASKRVARYAYQRAEADRQAAALREENAKLKAQLEGRGSQAQGDAQRQDPNQQRQAGDSDPKPTWESGQFETFDDFADARDAWRERQREKAAAPANEQGANAGGETIEVGGQRVKLPEGFDAAKFTEWNNRSIEMFKDGAERFGEDFQKTVTADGLPFDPAFTDFIYHESDDTAGVIYTLAKDPDFAKSLRDDLAAGRGTRVARELGLIEARTSNSTGNRSSEGIDSETGADQQTRARNKISNAPPPPPRVESSGSAGLRKDPGEMTQREYEAWREKGGGR